MKKQKLIFSLLWFLVVSIGIYTVLKTTVFTSVFSNYQLLFNFLSRISGVFLFTIIFLQIVLGSYIKKLSLIFGNWIYKVHVFQGTVIFLLVLIHPLFFLIFNFKLYHTIDPFYAYTQVCFLCKTKQELFYSLGRLALWFLTLGVFAAVFKNADNWMRNNWRKLHIVNYFVFFLVTFHGYFLGSDFKTFPLNIFFCFSVLVVLTTVVLKLIKKI